MLSTVIHNFFSQQDSQTKYWLALSGGLDSSVLLALCAAYQCEHAIDLKIIHINHNLNEKSAEWGKYCAAIARHYKLEYMQIDLQFTVQVGESLEERAREERYAIFAKYMQVEDVLLTAHQQDDQAETVLLQLLRGAGVKGLAAMPQCARFANGWHARPLLSVTRDTIYEYAEQQKLTWIEDNSNKNTELTRNFLRHEIMPRLKIRWPTVSKMLARSAGHCAEADALLAENSWHDWLKCAGSLVNTLSVEKLLQYPIAKQRLILRTWFQQFNHPLPNTKKLETICQQMLTAEQDKQPLVSWQTTEIRRHGDDLYLLKSLVEHDATQIFQWNLQHSSQLSLGNLGQLTAQITPGYGLRMDIKNITIRFRVGGESYHLGKRGKQCLKNLFQEWQIPPWERNRIPLIFVEDCLAMIMGYYIDEAYSARDDESGYAFAWI